MRAVHQIEGETMTVVNRPCNHRDQKTQFPEGSTIESIGAVSCNGGFIPAGTLGKITGHCDDGRAWVFFDGYPEGHTFHAPSGYIRVVAAPLPDKQGQPTMRKRYENNCPKHGIYITKAPLPCPQCRAEELGRPPTQEQQPTPRPWGVPLIDSGETSDWLQAGITHGGEYGQEVATAHGKTNAEVLANARLIVTAVNQHDELAAFMLMVADMTMDQECATCGSDKGENPECSDHEPWEMPIDDAFDTVHSIIREARSIRRVFKL